MWKTIFEEEVKKDYYKKLIDFIEKEELDKIILPPKESRSTSFKLTPFDKVKVVIIGQDPYHNIDQAHGLSFSVLTDKNPPSLRNIFKELESDLNIKNISGNLTKWAKQGVLLLNTILTVEIHKPLSHKNKGWENLTLRVIKELNNKSEPVVFILWGAQAISLEKYLDNKNHLVIKSVHPSPFSAHNGFFGSKPFSKTNDFLSKNGIEKIDWQL